MARPKKLEGIDGLVAPQAQPSIQEITMLDWYVMGATIGLIYNDDNPNAAAEKIFDLAEALMAERKKRL
jgi:hypothetical protein